MARLLKLSFVVAALAITALLIIAADKLASLAMHTLLAHGEQWWWSDALATVTCVCVCLWESLCGDGAPAVANKDLTGLRHRRLKDGCSEGTVAARGLL